LAQTDDFFKSTGVGIIRSKHKEDKEHINPKLIEGWIEDFLKESEVTNIPSTLMKLEAKTALARYNLDRALLT